MWYASTGDRSVMSWSYLIRGTLYDNAGINGPPAELCCMFLDIRSCLALLTAINHPANTRRPNAAVMLDQRRKQWSTLQQHLDDASCLLGSE